MAAPPSLDDILTEAGFAHDEVLRSYLHHIRVRSVDALAHMFADGDALSAWVTRFTTAVQFGDPQQTVHLGTNDLVLGTTASLTAAWVRCRNAQPPAPAPPHTQPSQTTPGTQTAPAADPKVPKELPQGVYAELLRQYNTQTINGNNRKFPEEVILGADRAIARMWHEHHKSKHYTAPSLGEILTQRTFTAMGTINNSAKDRKSERTLTLDSNNTLVETTPRDWDPQNMMMILDGLDAIRWAWTFIQIGDETDINEFIDKFCRITRQHQQRLLQVKDSWETFTWQLAMKMRSGATFSKATKELLADTTTMNDILSQPAKKQPRTETRRPQNNSSQFRQPKGRGKNTWGNKGYQTTSYPYNNQPHATCPSLDAYDPGTLVQRRHTQRKEGIRERQEGHQIPREEQGALGTARPRGPVPWSRPGALPPSYQTTHTTHTHYPDLSFRRDRHSVTCPAPTGRQCLPLFPVGNRPVLQSATSFTLPHDAHGRRRRF